VPDDRTVTIAQAAELAGVTKATIRSRIARGTLKAVKRGELRRVSLAELQRAGLIENPAAVDIGEASPVTTDELLDRLQRQARELGEANAKIERLTRELEAERVLRERAERQR
jgi:excisionase family DNA binding protein